MWFPNASLIIFQHGDVMIVSVSLQAVVSDVDVQGIKLLPDFQIYIFGFYVLSVIFCFSIRWRGSGSIALNRS